MIHLSTEGIEFESSDMESKEPDYKAMWKEFKGRIGENEFFSRLYLRGVIQLVEAKHSPTPETLESVVGEFCEGPLDPQRYDYLFDKMRELTKVKT